MNTQTFEIKQLKKKFSETCAVDGIDLSIKPGEMVGIIGRSGAGKSTLLRMLNRLVDPTEGRIQYGNEEITSLKGKKLLQWRSKCSNPQEQNRHNFYDLVLRRKSCQSC